MSGDPWGGSEELWSQAALRLDAQGHQVSASVVGWPKLAPKITNLRDRGMAVWARPNFPMSWPERLRRKMATVCRAPAPEISWLRRTNPDLVIISQGYCQDGVAWMRYCAELGLPFMTLVHCNSDALWPDDESTRNMAKAYRAAAKVFCVSRHNLELLEGQIGEALPNAEVIWNPFNVPADEPCAWPAEDGIWRLACVARLNPSAKGQDLLFHALALPPWADRPVEINLYGAGPCAETLRRLAKKLNLSQVHFCGHVSSVKTIWEKNHLLVLPSRYEGLPLALVEAMWCGRPAVVTDIGGNAELCVDGETGFVAKAPVASLVGEALERAWNQRQRWQEMGQAARRRVTSLLPNDPVGTFCDQLGISAAAVNEIRREEMTTPSVIQVKPIV
jgi:glycosyltransferase involved in cell wall biosynthesis